VPKRPHLSSTVYWDLAWHRGDFLMLLTYAQLADKLKEVSGVGKKEPNLTWLYGFIALECIKMNIFQQKYIPISDVKSTSITVQKQ